MLATDLRALALVRVTLAGTTIADLACRLADVRAFQTDAGLLPRGVLTQTGEAWRLSVHLSSGDAWFQSALVLTQIALAAMVLFGHRARAATVLTFVLLASLNSRNPLILTGGDSLLMGLWFWGMFLPWSARWSVEAALSPNPPPEENRHSSWASAGLLLQALAALAFALATWRFHAAAAVALAALPGTGSWNWLVRRIDHGRLIRIYYDRDCAFCVTMCRLFRELLILPRCEILPAQEYGRARTLMEAHNSWVVIDGNDVAHTRWRAWVALIRHSLLLRGSAGLAGLKIWNRPGDLLYGFVARHRDKFGAVTALLFRPRDVRFETGRGAQRVAAAFIPVLAASHLAGAGVLPPVVASVLSPVVHPLRLDPPDWQGPVFPGDAATWLIGPASLEDGREANALRPGQAVSYTRTPAPPAARWRALHARLQDPGQARAREAYADYLCRSWNDDAAAGSRLVSLKLVSVVEQATVAEQHVLLRHDCPGLRPTDVAD